VCPPPGTNRASIRRCGRVIRIGDAAPLPLLSLRLRGPCVELAKWSAARGCLVADVQTLALPNLELHFFWGMEIVSSSTQQHTVPYTYYSLIGTKFVAQ
jgi:hypothetical protein